MTERKPAGMPFETWVDRQIREASERGAFDDLPGAGKPLPGGDQTYDENWWLKNRLRREGLSAVAALPTPLRLRKEAEQLPETLRALRSERAVREVVTDLNERILAWLRAPNGPRVPVRPVDAEAAVARWRAERTGGTASARTGGTPRSTPATAPPGTPSRRAPDARRPGWWRRLLGRRTGAGDRTTGDG